jgi:hypothetical protein
LNDCADETKSSEETPQRQAMRTLTFISKVLEYHATAFISQNGFHTLKYALLI